MFALAITLVMAALVALGPATAAAQTAPGLPQGPEAVQLQPKEKEVAKSSEAAKPPGPEAKTAKEAEELGPVIVTATRTPEPLWRVPAHVTVIRAEDIERSTAQDIPELLRHEAGIFVTKTATAPESAIVDFRGFNNGGGNGQRLLVLVDGRRVNEADSSFVDWALIPLENIERIEIVRGPASAVYGDNAVAGVIQVFTKTGEGPLAVSAGGSVGSYDTFREHFSVGQSLRGFSYRLFGRHEDGNGFRENSDFRATDLAGNIRYRATQDLTFHLTSSYHEDERERPGSLTRSEIDRVGRRGTVTAGDFSDVLQYSFNGGMEFQWRPGATLSLNAYFNRRETDFKILVPGAGQFSGDKTGDSVSVVLQNVMEFSLGGLANTLTLGGEWLREDFDTNDLIDFPVFFFVENTRINFDRKTYGLYVQNELSLTEDLVLSGGVRFDHGDFDFKRTTEDLLTSTTTVVEGDRDLERTSPKIALAYRFIEWASAYVSGAKSFRYPNRDELTGFFTPSLELDPEKATTYEVGMKVFAEPEIGPVTPRISANLAFYQMDVEDEILFDPTIIAFGRNENFEEIRHRGVEVDMKVHLIEEIQFFAAYAFTDAEIRSGRFRGNNLPVTPKHYASWQADFSPYPPLTLSIFGRYTGRRFFANDLNNEFGKRGSFTVWDTKLSYTQHLPRKWGKLEAFVAVNNLFDKKYSEAEGVSSTPPFGSRIGFFPAPERNFTFGLTYRF